MYAVQVLDNETRLVPDEIVPESASNPENKKPIKINLKKIMEYFYDNEKLIDITKQNQKRRKKFPISKREPFKVHKSRYDSILNTLKGVPRCRCRCRNVGTY